MDSLVESVVSMFVSTTILLIPFAALIRIRFSEKSPQNEPTRIETEYFTLKTDSRCLCLKTYNLKKHGNERRAYCSYRRG